MPALVRTFYNFHECEAAQPRLKGFIANFIDTLGPIGKLFHLPKIRRHDIKFQLLETMLCCNNCVIRVILLHNYTYTPMMRHRTISLALFTLSLSRSLSLSFFSLCLSLSLSLSISLPISRYLPLWCSSFVFVFLLFYENDMSRQAQWSESESEPRKDGEALLDRPKKLHAKQDPRIACIVGAPTLASAHRTSSMLSSPPS